MVDQLYAEHGPMLLAYATRLLHGDRGRAEDVVQETLLRAWQHADRLDPAEGSVRGWLMRVLRNLVVDGYRAARSRPVEASPDHFEYQFAGDLADQVLTSVVVRSALLQIGQEHRSVLAKLYLQDCTTAEAAEQLGIPAGTVKSRAFHGLRKLREIMGTSGRPEPRPMISGQRPGCRSGSGAARSRPR